MSTEAGLLVWMILVALQIVVLVVAVTLGVRWQRCRRERDRQPVKEQRRIPSGS